MTAASSDLGNVLDKLEGVKKNGQGFMARCPVPGHGQGNGDRNPSLSINEAKDGQILLNCFAGCEAAEIVAAIGLNLKDLFPKDNEHQQPEGMTLERYAKRTRLPIEFLSRLGLHDARRNGKPAVRMPYYGEDGNEVLYRDRVKADGHDKVKSQYRSSVCLYGLDRLDKIRRAGYVFLVEGESDTQTLIYHNKPVLGIPEAGVWKRDWDIRLDGIGKIFFPVEGDDANRDLLKKLSSNRSIAARLRIIEPRGAKDVSDMHRRDSKGFKSELDELMSEARPHFAHSGQPQPISAADLMEMDF
jgi:hypothetical protein